MRWLVISCSIVSGILQHNINWLQSRDIIHLNVLITILLVYISSLDWPLGTSNRPVHVIHYSLPPFFIFDPFICSTCYHLMSLIVCRNKFIEFLSASWCTQNLPHFIMFFVSHFHTPSHTALFKWVKIEWNLSNLDCLVQFSLFVISNLVECRCPHHPRNLGKSVLACFSCMKIPAMPPAPEQRYCKEYRRVEYFWIFEKFRFTIRLPNSNGQCCKQYWPLIIFVIENRVYGNFLWG